MIIQCAWCKKIMDKGTCEPNEEVSDHICFKCAEDMRKEITEERPQFAKHLKENPIEKVVKRAMIKLPSFSEVYRKAQLEVYRTLAEKA